MDLLKDFGVLAYMIAKSWVSLASGLVGLAITIFERWRAYKHGSRRDLGWNRYVTILVLCLVPPFFEAWHGLNDKVRALEAEKEKLSAEVASFRTPPPARIKSDNNSTAGSESPIVTGSGNTVTIASQQPDRPAAKRPQEKP